MVSIATSSQVIQVIVCERYSGNTSNTENVRVFKSPQSRAIAARLLVAGFYEIINPEFVAAKIPALAGLQFTLTFSRDNFYDHFKPTIN